MSFCEYSIQKAFLKIFILHVQLASTDFPLIDWILKASFVKSMESFQSQTVIKRTASTCAYVITQMQSTDDYSENRKSCFHR